MASDIPDGLWHAADLPWRKGRGGEGRGGGRGGGREGEARGGDGPTHIQVRPRSGRLMLEAGSLCPLSPKEDVLVDGNVLLDGNKLHHGLLNVPSSVRPSDETRTGGEGRGEGWHSLHHALTRHQPSPLHPHRLRASCSSLFSPPLLKPATWSAGAPKVVM